jgi:hypothetical protein
MKKSRVVGLDLSITATGICASNGETYTVGGKSALGDERLVLIKIAILDNLDADIYIIEDLPTHAHGAGVTGMVHGVVRATLLENKKKYILVTPASLKKYATGKGNANKVDMAIALYERFGIKLPDDNQVDAYWLRMMGLDYFGIEKIYLPQVNKSVFEKINWGDT